jgi:hypothetical protein
MKFRYHVHQNGNKAIPKTITDRVEEVLASVNSPLKRRSASQVRQDILMPLRYIAGWSDKVRISAKCGLTLTAKKGQTALCLQTGNMARFYADLLKLQAQFVDGKITSAIYILPTLNAAKEMGENMANFERMTAELATTFFKVITVPLIVYGFYSA